MLSCLPELLDLSLLFIDEINSERRRFECSVLHCLKIIRLILNYIFEQVLAERVLGHSKIKVRWDSEAVSFQVRTLFTDDVIFPFISFVILQGKKVRVLPNGLQVQVQ